MRWTAVIQVWSLTQFYSVDFSKSRIGEKSGVSTDVQSMFASAFFDGVLHGTPDGDSVSL